MVIGILSAVMSVASISVLTASANYARDIHQRYLRPDLPPSAMLRIGTLASLGAGGLGLLLAWKMRDIIDILQFGFTLNSAGLFLPTILAIYSNRVPASAAFWSTGASLATVIAWRVAAGAGANGIFAIDPLWPGLLVSALLLLVLTAWQPRRDARVRT
jgi:SSS family solute:Na+ symporter